MRPSGEPTRIQASAVGAAVLVVALGSQAGGAANAVHKVGAVTWHAAKFVGKDVVLEGYVLAKEPGYVLFSDEATGKITAHDLPVTGPGRRHDADQSEIRDRGCVPRSGPLREQRQSLSPGTDHPAKRSKALSAERSPLPAGQLLVF